jgi:hypothetical protein
MLHQRNEAVASIKEGVKHSRNLFGTSHPEYATSLNNLAVLFAGIPRFEEVLTIRQRVHGDQHELTVAVGKRLAFVRQRAQQSLRDIDVGHTHRMCSQCARSRR